MEMKRLFKSAITAMFISCFFFSNVYAIDKGNFPVTPKMNNGKKWRVGYLEGGPYQIIPTTCALWLRLFQILAGLKNPLSRHQPMLLIQSSCGRGFQEI